MLLKIISIYLILGLVLVWVVEYLEPRLDTVRPRLVVIFGWVFKLKSIVALLVLNYQVGLACRTLRTHLRSHNVFFDKNLTKIKLIPSCTRLEHIMPAYSEGMRMLIQMHPDDKVKRVSKEMQMNFREIAIRYSQIHESIFM